MDDTHIHTCSYYCEYPNCIKRQRDEMREKLLQQHEWVGLTDDEIDLAQIGLMREHRHGNATFARAIEKILREKNK